MRITAIYWIHGSRGKKYFSTVAEAAQFLLDAEWAGRLSSEQIIDSDGKIYFNDGGLGDLEKLKGE